MWVLVTHGWWATGSSVRAWDGWQVLSVHLMKKCQMNESIRESFPEISEQSCKDKEGCVQGKGIGRSRLQGAARASSNGSQLGHLLPKHRGYWS